MPTSPRHRRRRPNAATAWSPPHDPHAPSTGELTRLQAEWAIERLIRRFALLNDAGDAEALAALFTADGRFARPSDPDHPVVGREAIAAHFRGRPPRLTRHLVVNTVVELEEVGRARAQSYILLYTAPPADVSVVIADPVQLVGGFEDRLVLEQDAWRFVERRGSLAMKTKPA